MNNILQPLRTGTYECFDAFSEVYVFGSALWSQTPGDLDLLLVYEPSMLSLVAEAEQRVIAEMSDAFPYLPVHLTTLSDSELVSTGFLNRIVFIRIK